MKPWVWIGLAAAVAWVPASAWAQATPAPAPAGATAQAPAFKEKPATPALMAELRKGGFVLYMRHGNTDNSRPDRVPEVDLKDCATQRPLNDEGRALMRRVGQAIQSARIPLGRILVSPMCRTQESARLAVGERFETADWLMYSANMTSAEKKPRIEALRQMLGTRVPGGTNVLLLAHAPNLADLIGFFVKPEGTMVVFRQTATGGFEYAASIHPDDWARLK